MFSEDIFTQLGLKISTLIAGLVGGLISLSYQKQMKWYKAVAIIIVGGITAAYTTPLLVTLFSMGQPLEHSLAFIMGLLGMRLTTAIIVGIEKIAENPAEFIRKLRGK